MSCVVGAAFEKLSGGRDEQSVQTTPSNSFKQMPGPLQDYSTATHAGGCSCGTSRFQAGKQGWKVLGLWTRETLLRPKVSGQMLSTMNLELGHST